MEFLIWIIFTVYGITFYLYWQNFFSKTSRTSRQAQRWLVLALTIQLGFMLYQIWVQRRLPVASVSETLGTFVWLTAAIYWVLENRLKEHSMGTFILPILLLLLIISNLTFQSREVISPLLKDVSIQVHVLSLLLAYGAFSISFITSLLLLLLRREIHRRNLGVFYSRLPSMPFFERISNAAVDVGLGFATLGLILGIFYAIRVWGNFLLTDPKFVSAFLTWLIYVLHFLGRRLAGWQGPRAATLSIIGFGWLLFSFVIISIFFTRVHHFA